MSMTDAELQTLENLGHGDAAEEIRELRSELAASREREARMRAKLEYALQQNDLDMLLTGDEIRDCRAALAEGAQR